MKIVKTVLAGLMASALLSSGAMAANNQGGGIILFKGNIVDAPCSLVQDSSEAQTVDMGVLSNSAIRNGNTPVKNFNLRLEGCDLQRYGADGNASGDKWSGVKVTFSGPSVGDNNTQYLSATDNVGIELTQGGKALTIGSPADKVLIQSGSQMLPFGAQVKVVDKSKPIPLKNFTATANFTMEYE